MRAILLAAVLTSALLAPARAQTLEQQWAWCRDGYSERLIRSCTAVIRSGRQSRDELARAYFNRGRAWSDQGQYDRAMPDFDEAIRLDPDYPDAFNSRGVTWAGEGQYEKAIADFSEAIRLDPNYAIAIFNRGLAARNLGRTDQAARDFANAKLVGPRLIPPKE
jgi:tetratricopeptide (TPR) repeat protein